MASFCDHHYTKACYQWTYFDIIHPVPDLSMVEYREDPEDIVLPLHLKSLPGRPRKNRRHEPGEGPSGPGVARRSTTMRCDNCKQFGHNKRTCQRDPTTVKFGSRSMLSMKVNLIL